MQLSLPSSAAEHSSRAPEWWWAGEYFLPDAVPWYKLEAFETFFLILSVQGPDRRTSRSELGDRGALQSG
jgi:hypothetical protein